MLTWQKIPLQPEMYSGWRGITLDIADCSAIQPRLEFQSAWPGGGRRRQRLRRWHIDDRRRRRRRRLGFCLNDRRRRLWRWWCHDFCCWAGGRTTCDGRYDAPDYNRSWRRARNYRARSRARNYWTRSRARDRARRRAWAWIIVCDTKSISAWATTSPSMSRVRAGIESGD